VARAGELPTLLVTGTEVAEARLDCYRAAGVEVVAVPRGAAGALDLEATMAAIGARGVGRLMVESGGRLAAALLSRDLVDRILWYRAPLVIGGDGVAAVAPLDVRRMADSRRFRSLRLAALGKDSLEVLAREQD